MIGRLNAEWIELSETQVIQLPLDPDVRGPYIVLFYMDERYSVLGDFETYEQAIMAVAECSKVPAHVLAHPPSTPDAD
jgi:hypothetical protein